MRDAMMMRGAKPTNKNKPKIIVCSWSFCIYAFFFFYFLGVQFFFFSVKLLLKIQRERVKNFLYLFSSKFKPKHTHSLSLAHTHQWIRSSLYMSWRKIINSWQSTINFEEKDRGIDLRTSGGKGKWLLSDGLMGCIVYACTIRIRCYIHTLFHSMIYLGNNIVYKTFLKCFH